MAGPPFKYLKRAKKLDTRISSFFCPTSDHIHKMKSQLAPAKQIGHIMHNNVTGQTNSFECMQS